MSGRANNAPAGEQDNRNEESLVAPVAYGEGARHRHGTQTAAARWNGSQLPGPGLIGLVRLLAREAARETWETSQTKDSTSHDQDHHVAP